jgi:hypothetical protein
VVRCVISFCISSGQDDNRIPFEKQVQETCSDKGMVGDEKGGLNIVELLAPERIPSHHARSIPRRDGKRW